MPIVMQVEVDGRPVVLVEEKVWEGRGVDPDPTRQADPISTAPRPRVLPEKGSTAWLLVGHTLSRHDEPGDTVVTWTLLCEVHADGTLEGFWWEDHMEVPIALSPVTGRVAGHHVDLTVAGENPRTLAGEIWPKR